MRARCRRARGLRTGRRQPRILMVHELIAYCAIMRSVGYWEARKCRAKSYSFGRPKLFVMRPVAQRGGGERDEVNGLKLLQRQQQADGIKAAYVFINERGQPFGRMGIGRMIERAGEAAGLPFPVHAHMLRHSTGYALAARGMDTRRLQHFLGHASITNTVRYTAMSPEPFKDIWR